MSFGYGSVDASAFSAPLTVTWQGVPIAARDATEPENQHLDGFDDWEASLFRGTTVMSKGLECQGVLQRVSVVLFAVASLSILTFSLVFTGRDKSDWSRLLGTEAEETNAVSLSTTTTTTVVTSVGVDYCEWYVGVEAVVCATLFFLSVPVVCVLLAETYTKCRTTSSLPSSSPRGQQRRPSDFDNDDAPCTSAHLLLWLAVFVILCYAASSLDSAPKKLELIEEVQRLEYYSDRRDTQPTVTTIRKLSLVAPTVLQSHVYRDIQSASTFSGYCNGETMEASHGNFDSLEAKSRVRAFSGTGCNGDLQESVLLRFQQCDFFELPLSPWLFPVGAHPCALCLNPSDPEAFVGAIDQWFAQQEDNTSQQN